MQLITIQHTDWLLHQNTKYSKTNPATHSTVSNRKEDQSPNQPVKLGTRTQSLSVPLHRIT